MAAPLPPTPDVARVLQDAWPQARPGHLDGPVEQRGVHPLLGAIVTLLVAWFLFQLVGGVLAGIAIVVAVMGEGRDLAAIGDAAELMARFPGVVLLGNTVGQLLGLGGVTWWATRRRTRSGKAAFLRLRRPDLPGLGLAALGWAVGLPFLFWLGDLNASLPLPEWLDALERLQADLLGGLLLGERIGTGWLLVALAVTPALSEELLFRGYLQRQVERTWGAVASIVLVGIVFGLFHLRFSQVLPLAALGVYLGFAVWATGSLWTGSLLHVLHNGTVIVGTAVFLRQPGADAATLGTLALPTWLAFGSTVALALAVRTLHRRRERVTGGGADAVEVREPLYELAGVPPLRHGAGSEHHGLISHRLP